VGPRQIVLGIIVDTNKMTFGITGKYLPELRELFNKWYLNKCMFKVGDMQKLVGKLARLGKGAPWIFKLMPHVYMSLAYALKSN
jgi:hypothetical protein